MATLNNPFVVYGYKGAEYFCDRLKETEKMISTLHNERNITLVAPRRMGKTGLIHHVFHQMEEQYEGVKCFYLDILPPKTWSKWCKSWLLKSSENLIRFLNRPFVKFRSSSVVGDLL